MINHHGPLTVVTCAAVLLGQAAAAFGQTVAGPDHARKDDRPNIVFVLTDDQRWDSVTSFGNELLHTPNLDRISSRGTRFSSAFVTLAICSPSRAACLTGRYGSANGVTAVGNVSLNDGETSFANALRAAGYVTGVTGKWHLHTTPEKCGFQFASTCWSNGTWYDRQFTINGESKIMAGFVDDVVADESIRFIRQTQEQGNPFVLWMCTQVPHMDHRYTWPAKQEFLRRHTLNDMPVPETWDDDLTGKPEYLLTSRNRTQARKYGYDDPENIRRHTRDYCASVEQMDAAVGRVFDELDRLDLRDKTWMIFMGDNGWMLGEHGMTSKVLPYEESMRVPMAIAGPSTTPRVSNDLVLNIDLTATIYELAGLPIPEALHGRSLLPIVTGQPPKKWRNSFLYEAPTPQLGSKPLWAVRSDRWKYVETQVGEDEVFEELYDLQSDAIESKNVADDPANQSTIHQLAAQLREHKREIATQETDTVAEEPKIPESPPPTPRTDLFISGVYPHLTTYGVYSQNGAHYKDGHNECGIGAVVPWAGKLWMVNYAPHQPKGSEHKLFSVDPDLRQPMTIHPESVGGTPAGRMIHAESNQLLIAHYLIDTEGKVRTISPKDMPIRVTAIARHLSDPTNMVYYVDMEGSIWEANVHTLAVKRLFKKPVPGWHGKGGYTSQGRLVVSNNGELHVGNYNDVLVGGEAQHEEERGVLAEFDGKQWTIIERRQFTEVTGPSGITGGSEGNDPLWTMGWDRRSVRLKVLDDGQWHTYLLPKATYCNDASHGWYTEWPRIREITAGRWMMDMHGMFFNFPKTFSAKDSAGITPIGSHLRYVPDFCDWNGRLVLASDETSIQGNELAGQPQSNLWLGSYEDLQTWGPASAYGGPWIEDAVKANQPSDPFLIAGFDRRVLHLVVGRKKQIPIEARRATALGKATVTRPTKESNNGDNGHLGPIEFTLQVDQQGNGVWTDAGTVTVAVDGYVAHFLPENLEAIWLRLKANRDCLATAFLHQTADSYVDGGTAENKKLFAGLADVTEEETLGALLYAAKRNRNLRVITADDRHFEFTKASFEFQADKPDARLESLLRVEPEFTVDEASVVLQSQGRTYRLPKGNPAFDKPFASGWPRASREVESERHLANIHGTFYEIPLVTNGAPPAWNQMRPVSSHSKQITDFCSWNGLLVLAGVRVDAKNDGHVFADPDNKTALWFGGIDDLWKFGKPVGDGGPWFKTKVKAGIPSDPYLMTGYDWKTVRMSHQSREPVTFTLQVDLDGSGLWVDYQAFAIAADEQVTHEFPAPFSACWMRAVSDRDTAATVLLEYR